MERSGTARQPQLLGQKKDKFWLTVGLCALTAALFFLPFYIIDGGFFHYAGDFNSQQISFYRYMNGFIKGAGYPDSAFTSVHNTFSWATDLGSGVMNAYSFYLYGSPFFWFSLLFPQGWLPYLMVPLLVFKFAVVRTCICAATSKISTTPCWEPVCIPSPALRYTMCSSTTL